MHTCTCMQTHIQLHTHMHKHTLHMNMRTYTCTHRRSMRLPQGLVSHGQHSCDDRHPFLCYVHACFYNYEWDYQYDDHYICVSATMTPPLENKMRNAITTDAYTHVCSQYLCCSNSCANLQISTECSRSRPAQSRCVCINGGMDNIYNSWLVNM